MAAQALASRGPIGLPVVREILAEQYAEDEERFWAKEGEERLETFDRTAAVSHKDAWS